MREVCMWLYDVVYGGGASAVSILASAPVMLFLFWYASRKDSGNTKYPVLWAVVQLGSTAYILICMWAGLIAVFFT